MKILNTHEGLYNKVQLTHLKLFKVEFGLGHEITINNNIKSILATHLYFLKVTNNFAGHSMRH